MFLLLFLHFCPEKKVKKFESKHLWENKAQMKLESSKEFKKQHAKNMRIPVLSTAKKGEDLGKIWDKFPIRHGSWNAIYKININIKSKIVCNIKFIAAHLDFSCLIVK